jgi:hypothetical protein
MTGEPENVEWAIKSNKEGYNRRGTKTAYNICLSLGMAGFVCGSPVASFERTTFDLSSGHCSYKCARIG